MSDAAFRSWNRRCLQEGEARIDAEHYKRLEAVFHEAVELEGRERELYLDRACAGDDGLRRHVELLLGHDLGEDEETIVDRPGMGKELLASALDAEARKPPPVPRPETIGRYTIADRIAEGGMGVVYLAEQDHPRRQVALKVIRPGVFTEELLKRFEFEADLLGRLQHPGIARIYDAGEAETEAGRQPYYAMEYIEGVPLTEHAEARDLSPENRLRLLARICDAVHHAHQHGIVHRDLKPANLLVVEAVAPEEVTPSAGMVDPVGQPKVLDFGVSRLLEDQPAQITRLTQTGFVVGTVAYMSPEQASGDQGLDTRSDVYSLGVIGFELLAGRLPHECREMPFVQALRMIQEEPAPQLSSVRREHRGDVSIIIGKALATDRERRYSSAAAMAEDIRRYLSHQPIAARPPTLGYQVGRFVRRHKALVGATAVAVLGLVIGLVFALLAMREEARQRVVAEHHTEESRRSAYAALIQLAARYAAAGDTESARRRLESTPSELRGWEWEFLSRSLEDELSHVPMAIATRTPSLLSDETRALVLTEGNVLRLVDLLRQTWSDHALGAGRPTAAFLADDGRTVLLGVRGTGVSRLTFGDDAGPDTLFPTNRFIRTFLSEGEADRVLVSSSRGEPLARAGKIHRLDLRTGSSSEILTGTWTATSLALAPDGRTLAVGGIRGALQLFDLATGRLLFENADREHALQHLAFSPDGRRVSTAHPAHGIRVFDVASGRVERDFISLQHEVTALRFHPDSDTLVAGYTNGRIRHWHVPSGECRWTTLGRESAEGTDRRVLALAFPGDGGLVRSVAADGLHVRPARPPLATVLPHAPGPWPFAYDVEFDPTGRHLLSCGWDGRVRIRDVATREEIAVLRHAQYAHWARFSRNGEHLLVGWKNGFTDSVFEILSATTFRRKAGFDTYCPNPRGEFVPGTGTAILGIAMEVRLVDAADLGTRATVEGESEVRSLAVSPDGTLVACGRLDGTVTLRSTRDLSELRRFQLAAESAQALRFSPDGRRLAAGGKGRTLQVFEVPSGRELLRVDCPESREVLSIRFTPDGRRLFIGSRHTAIVVRDAFTGRELLPLEGHDSYVHGLALSPDARILASASGDNTVRIWDARPLKDRIRERDRMHEARAKTAGVVEDLIAKTGGVEAALSALPEATDLTDVERHAARNGLLRRLGE
ncbi:MAG: serine/threonine-protein kinase [Planctomycetota bacterium]